MRLSIFDIDYKYIKTAILLFDEEVIIKSNWNNTEITCNTNELIDLVEKSGCDVDEVTQVVYIQPVRNMYNLTVACDSFAVTKKLQVNCGLKTIAYIKLPKYSEVDSIIKKSCDGVDYYITDDQKCVIVIDVVQDQKCLENNK